MNQGFPVHLTDQSQLDYRDLEDQLNHCNQTNARSVERTLKASKPTRSKRTQSNDSLADTPKAFVTVENYKSNSCFTQQVIINQPNKSFENRSRASSQISTNRRPIKRPSKIKMSELKDVIMNQKVNGLKELFCKKVKRNNPYSPPIQYEFQSNSYNKSFFVRSGLEMNENQEKVFSIVSIFNIISSVFIFTLSIALPQIQEHLIIRIIQLFGATLYFAEILVNFATIKFTLGRKLETLKEISQDYIQHKFPVDCANLLIVFLYIATHYEAIAYFRIFILFKIPDCMEKIEKLQVFFIENHYNEQYWSLVKVFLFNFCFAHMLAVILLTMAEINQGQNWLQNKNLVGSPWYEKYIWSYYWGTTIMLTIGFGDLIPACYQEALCMIFIETISCIVLAYNINCVGSLIAYIRSQDIEKSKNLKIFKKLVDKNHISEPLSEKINSYIEEHTNIKKFFNIEEEVQFVEKLPTAFRTDYLKEANKAIFKKLFFFSHLMEKTLFALAENIVMKVTHPQEIILTQYSNFNIFILKHGQIGYVSRKAKRKYNSYVFDRVKVEENNRLFLLNTNFITKNRSNYGIKSIAYSVLYCLKYDSLIDVLKQAHLDYQLYCRMRDKKRNKIDQFQVVTCQFCLHQKHTKFACPKLHFLPFQQHVINRYLYKQKQSKNIRNKSFSRTQQPMQTPLKRFLLDKDEYDSRIRQAENVQSKTAKKQKFVIQQLARVFNDVLEEQTNRSIPQPQGSQSMTLQSEFLENVEQIIKISINKALGVENGEDEVWTLNLDRLKNYKEYFPEANSSNLINSLCLGSSAKQIDEKNMQGKLGYKIGAQQSFSSSKKNKQS